MERNRAGRAGSLIKSLVYPSSRDLNSMITGGAIKFCPVTIRDVEVHDASLNKLYPQSNRVTSITRIPTHSFSITLSRPMMVLRWALNLALCKGFVR